MPYPSELSATEQSLSCLSFVAAADLHASQFHFVALDVNGYVNLPAGANAVCLGVLQDKPAFAGDVATVAIGGISRVYVGSGGVTAGNRIANDASGHAIAGSTGYVNGTAMTTAAEGHLCEVLVQPLTYQHA